MEKFIPLNNFILKFDFNNAKKHNAKLPNNQIIFFSTKKNPMKSMRNDNEKPTITTNNMNLSFCNPKRKEDDKKP